MTTDDLMDVRYNDDYAESYTNGLEYATIEVKALRKYLHRWFPFAQDAFVQFDSNADFDLFEFKSGLARERSGKFAGEEWAEKYGAIIMPEFLADVSLMASKFHVPWGVMFLRLREAHVVVIVDDSYFAMKKEIE